MEREAMMRVRDTQEEVREGVERTMQWAEEVVTQWVQMSDPELEERT